jgi:serine/threonine protein phosphatase PrpC
MGTNVDCHRGWTLDAAEMRGARSCMEDVTHVWQSLDYDFVHAGVYDGHAGSGVVRMIPGVMHATFDPSASDIGVELERAYGALQAATVDKALSGGATALTAHIDTESGVTHVANLGDCRAVRVHRASGVVRQVTTDHKPDVAAERAAIEARGGRVTRASSSIAPARVNGILAVSRALGDNGLPIGHAPDVTTFTMAVGDVLVLACDGIWDVLSNEQVGALLVAHDVTKPGAATALCREAYRRQSFDNLSAVVIVRNEAPPPDLEFGDVVSLCDYPTVFEFVE